METSAEERQWSQRKKGGHPAKKTKRSFYLKAWVTETERLLIMGKAREAGLSTSAWLRAAAKETAVMARLTPQEAALLRMLSGLANNLNQLARLAHLEELLSLQGKCLLTIGEIDNLLQRLQQR